jgi:small basic protein (TIGR04137 family)
MSIHPSLRGVNTLVGERSVFTRRERIEKLMSDGKLADDGSAYGLPKVRTKFKLKGKRAAVKKEKDAKETVAEDKDAKKGAKKAK